MRLLVKIGLTTVLLLSLFQAMAEEVLLKPFVLVYRGPGTVAENLQQLKRR